jgi:hypothetical protein
VGRGHEAERRGKQPVRTDCPAFERTALMKMAAQLRDPYQLAVPFPHIVIDDFVDADLLDAVVGEFPKPDEIQWWAFDDDREKKLGTRDEAAMGPITRNLFAQLNSATMIDFLQTLTGISGLVPDPHLFGGGLHQIQAGGFLKIHADFNLHPATALERRLNLLIYLNKQWNEEYGGHLELWDMTMTRCIHRIAPVFNRCVIFTTGETSYHGHPEPLRCPSDRTRKSLALYYYSAPRTSSGVDVVAQNTVFRARPGENLSQFVPAARASSRRHRAHEIVNRWLPPVAVDALRQAKGRLAPKN